MRIHPDRLHGQMRKKLCCVNDGFTYPKNSRLGNTMKDVRFWIEVLQCMESNTRMSGRQTYDMVNEKWKTVHLNVVRFCGVYDNVMRRDEH
ncbi:hypothetical protein Tco_1453980, partial [Tanacetum coccineum]